MRFFRLVFALAILSVTGSLATGQIPAAADPTPPVSADNTASPLTDQTERYRIGFQDILDIQVFRHTDLSQRVAVSPNGTIVLFRLDHPIIAVCKTERELATEIENAYKENYLKDPRVNVAVAEQRSQSVAIIGAVEKPGNYFINRRYHLLEMLAMAGGPNKESGTRLLIARTGSTSNCRDKGEDTNGDQVAVTDLKIRDIQEGKQTYWMQPGDVVSVLDADIVYVYGNVNKQGAVKVREPITLTQAIVSAEGLRPAAKKSAIRVLRQVPNGGDRQELVFDLNQIDKGKIKDPFLNPGDIVAVSEDQTRKILMGIAGSIKTALPSAVYRIP
jgi:polysaccharide export outer membrane protein